MSQAWNQEFRIDNAPEDTRYGSIFEALKARNRVRNMVPGRTKGKKESGGKRPNYITAERAHHSRGKKWEEFLKASGYEMLSEIEQQLLMDSSKLGGNEVFARWKEREFRKWSPIERVYVFEYTSRTVVMVKLKDGTIIEQPYIDPNKKKAGKKVSRGPKKGRTCATCHVSMPTSIPDGQVNCNSCSPTRKATGMFADIFKKAK